MSAEDVSPSHEGHRKKSLHTTQHTERHTRRHSSINQMYFLNKKIFSIFLLLYKYNSIIYYLFLYNYHHILSLY